jgi:hypothetical protein
MKCCNDSKELRRSGNGLVGKVTAWALALRAAASRQVKAKGVGDILAIYVSIMLAFLNK